MKEWLYTNWTGIVLAPIFWILLFILLGFANRQTKAIKEWYLGLPIVQWPAMWLVIIGCKVLRRKSCFFKHSSGRIWLSPNVRGFAIPEPPAAKDEFPDFN
jgi:hypothetical protein